MAAEPQLDTPLDLGAWQGDRAQLATARRSSYGDIDDLPPELRFQVYVSRAVRAREYQADAETTGAAAFILVTSQQQEALKIGRTFDRTIHTGRVRLAGRVHFMTPRAASSVFQEYAGDANGVFNRIADLQCDRLPTLVYDPSAGKSTLTYYPQGTHTDDGLVEVQLDASPPIDGLGLTAAPPAWQIANWRALGVVPSDDVRSCIMKSYECVSNSILSVNACRNLEVVGIPQVSNRIRDS